MPGRVGEGLGPLLFIGAAVAVVGTVLAFGIPTHTPLAISGYILLLMALMIVWHQL
jgi:putative Ca2+/H+ antiporter (TMEM165/GDT1 family)